MKHKGTTAKLLIVAMMLIMVMALNVAPASAGVPDTDVLIQMGICVDASDSIGADNFDDYIKPGLVNAVENEIPRNGIVELSIVWFGRISETETKGAAVVVPPTVITDATVPGVVAAINSMVYRSDGWTPMAVAIDTMVATMQSSSNWSTSHWQIINITTDGVPITSFYDQYGNWNYPKGNSAYRKAQTELAVAAAVAAGIDEIDAESIDPGPTADNGPDPNWMAGKAGNYTIEHPALVHPYVGYIVGDDGWPPRPPDPGHKGFVLDIASFEDYSVALAEKVGQVIPQLILLPPEATNKVGDPHTVCATYRVSGNPVEGELITFVVTDGPNAGVSGTGVTDVDGQACFTYISELTGTDTIVAYTGYSSGDGISYDLESNVAIKRWIPGQSVPGVTEWGIIAMVTLMAAAGLYGLRRRQAMNVA